MGIVGILRQIVAQSQDFAVRSHFCGIIKFSLQKNRVTCNNSFYNAVRNGCHAFRSLNILDFVGAKGTATWKGMLMPTTKDPFTVQVVPRCADWFGTVDVVVSVGGPVQEGLVADDGGHDRDSGRARQAARR